MRLFRRFTSGESREIAVHCPASSLAMAYHQKSLRAAERKRADVARARRRWIREQGFLEPADETAVTTNMVRLNDWNRRGGRFFSDAPMGH
jgi:hypothetical protein